MNWIYHLYHPHYHSVWDTATSEWGKVLPQVTYKKGWSQDKSHIAHVRTNFWIPVEGRGRLKGFDPFSQWLLGITNPRTWSCLWIWQFIHLGRGFHSLLLLCSVWWLEQSRRSLLSTPGQNNWMKAARSETASKPFFISECLPLFDIYINSWEPLPDSRSVSLQ